MLRSLVCRVTILFLFGGLRSFYARLWGWVFFTVPWKMFVHFLGNFFFHKMPILRTRAIKKCCAAHSNSVPLLRSLAKFAIEFHRFTKFTVKPISRVDAWFWLLWLTTGQTSLLRLIPLLLSFRVLFHSCLNRLLMEKSKSTEQLKEYGLAGLFTYCLIGMLTAGVQWTEKQLSVFRHLYVYHGSHGIFCSQNVRSTPTALVIWSW